MKKLILAVGILICLFLFFLSTIGWWGYEKWKPRRSTHGNKVESLERGVFIKNLQYFSSIKIKDFTIYIEKGYKYGYVGEYQTRIIDKDIYPYQISFVEKTNDNNINFYIINKDNFNLSFSSILLQDTYLKDTLLIGVDRYTNKWDSIGYIKVWDKEYKVKYE